MDTKLLLIRIITLLFLESKQSDRKNNSSINLIETAMGYIKAPDASITSEFSRDPTSKLIEIVKWLMKSERGTIEESDILTRVKIATETEDYIYDAFESNVRGRKTAQEIKIIAKTNREHIGEFVTRNAIKAHLKEAYTNTHFKPDSVDWDHIVKDMITTLEPYKNNSSNVSQHLVSSVDISDIDSLRNSFKSATEQVSKDGAFTFGWQGLNRMFGQSGGARRGEMICVAALQHNFKSGFVLEMLKSAALYNKPYLFDKARKPLLLRISLENSTTNDILHLYKSLIEPELETTIDINSIDPLEAATYVNKRLTENGWHIRMEQYNPSEFTIFDLMDIVEKYEDEGFEVCMLNIDYLAMMSTKGCKQSGATGQDIRDLFRRTRNMGEAKKITVVTPAQLSTEAKKLTRQGVEDFVKEIANKGYYDSCSTIDQELDVEIYIHLVKINGETYITVQRGKHRGLTEQTPLKDLYFTYKFSPYAYILDDVNGADQSRRRVGASTQSEGGESAWWDMAA